MHHEEPAATAAAAPQADPARQYDGAARHQNVDRHRAVLHVRRVYVDGRVKLTGKTPNSVPRVVPLTERVLEAVDAISTYRYAVVVPGGPGRSSEPAQLASRRLESRRLGAGLEHRTPYAMRHTFASFAIAAGIPTFEIARMMGTTGAVLIGHGQRMKSPNDLSAHLNSDGLGGYWVDLSGAFKGDHEGALLAAREWAEQVGALEGIGQIDYVRLQGTDGTDEFAFGEETDEQEEPWVDE